jgi:ABC-2 type transport system permease protein
MKVNWTVIKAIAKRDLRLYFSNPTGYVFITLFIFLSAAAAFWRERFFLNNLANLDQLNDVFPFLLLIFVPTITMGVWAEERKQGTDELLLTLPATDLEVVLGKYLSTVGIYTAAVLLSLSHLVVLYWLGKPDPGLMLSNYLGYWLLGATFIAIGMLASLLSANVTVAFVVGAIFCALFVYIQPIAGIFGSGAESLVEQLSVFPHFDDFSSGVASLTALVYFLSVIGLMLYLNVVLLGRRHWPQEVGRNRMGVHQAARAVALAAALIAFNVFVGRATARVDLTAERLHTLSGETRELIHEISKDRPVFVQAYISPNVPTEYVQARGNLIGKLKEIDAVGGDKVHLVIYDTEPYSDEARAAREKYGITAVEVQALEGSRAKVDNVFMGVAFTCGAEEDVIPFFNRGLPVEYELVRSIRVVAQTKRKRIGVVTTQANMFGGFDFNTFASKPAWSIVGELEKQYDVVQIAVSDSVTEKLDGMLVALPSSLSQEEMDNLQNYIERGTPTLMLLDPLPIVDIGLSPSEEAGANINPFMRNRGPQPKPKGGIQTFLQNLGIKWNKAMVVWDAYNPHPELANIRPEIVFVGRGNRNPESFDDSFSAVAGLQELVFLFPGAVDKSGSPDYTFEPLVKSSTTSGVLHYNQLVQRSFLGVGLSQANVPHYPSGSDYAVAARVRSSASDSTGVDVIVIADLDFISEQFFEIRKRGIENLDFDNIPFILNCMDVLVNDESFIALRNRRVKHRTLTTVESKVRAYAEQRAVEQREAEVEAQRALSQAQQQLDQKVAEVRRREDLDDQTKSIMARNLQEVESRRFEAVQTTIEADRDAKIEHSKEVMESQVRAIQSNIKTLAGLLPPIPVFGLGVVIFVKRRRREKEGAAAARRLRS